MDKEKLGLIHIYCGDGKGKTTASLGLAIRSAGAGFKVFILQFLKEIYRLYYLNFNNIIFFKSKCLIEPLSLQKART